MVAAALLATGGCYTTGHGEEPAASATRPAPDAAVRGAPPHKRAPAGETKRKEPAQTVRQAWRLICHAERLSGAAQAIDRSTRGDIVAAWLAKNLKNKQVIYWYLAFGKLKKPEQPAVFSAQARKAGFSDCPLQALLFAPLPDAGTSGGG